MQVYLVGGAVRDEQLGLSVSERDWCVVGASPDEMLGLGYRQVGKDFPVFLHPDTNEEYALARTERKTAAGYHGFDFDTSTAVTLEEDLARRDLTINAMAQDADGSIVDPYGGLADLQRRLLRHVSDAFVEDPVRILRAARFAARYASLGFRVAPATRDLMRAMVADGEADALVPDRVWKETELALRGPNPRVYFENLRSCGALERVLPEVDALFGVAQPPRWHPEVDTGIHTLLSLDEAERLSELGEVRFAVLVHDLGKALTPKDKLPSHPGHERKGREAIRELAKRLPVPNGFRGLAEIVAEFHTHCHSADELKPKTIVRLLEQTDALRRPERFEAFLLACEADARGRTGLEKREYPQAGRLRQALASASSIDAGAIAAKTPKDRIAAAIHTARIQAVRESL